MEIADWHNPECRTVGVLLSPAVQDIRKGLADCGEYVLWLINAGLEDVRFRLPSSDVQQWPVLLDTSDDSQAPDKRSVSQYCELPARSICVLGKVPGNLS